MHQRLPGAGHRRVTDDEGGHMGNFRVMDLDYGALWWWLCNITHLSNQHGFMTRFKYILKFAQLCFWAFYCMSFSYVCPFAFICYVALQCNLKLGGKSPSQG
jgi:hypothetical protein